MNKSGFANDCSLTGNRNAVFDRLSSGYETACNRDFYMRSTRVMVDRVKKAGFLDAGGCCLDLACGTGISTEVVRDSFPHVSWVGADLSAEMLRVAAAKPALAGVRLVNTPADTTPFPDRAFDWIVCNVAYHWLPTTALTETLRILKPGGLLSMMVPLVSPAGKASGNQWLRRVLLAHSKQITSRRSQGLTMNALHKELGNFDILHAEIVDIAETFESPNALLRTLESRSSLAAIFGDQAELLREKIAARNQYDSSPLSFCWKFA